MSMDSNVQSLLCGQDNDEQMESDRKTHDWQWLMQEIRSDHLNLGNISISLSQLLTCCYQDGNSSMNINISKHDENAFTEVLSVIGSSSALNSSLRNLEFNFVEWDSTWLHQLGMFLDNNTSIKQVMFKQNRFGEEGVCWLCDILKRNKMVKEAIFAESELGFHGVTLLANALKMNDTLEEVQIWEDSIGSQGAEELAKMIEVNSALKLLTIFDSSTKEGVASPIISAVLARNRVIEVHFWSSGADQKITKVVEFVPEIYTLRVYRLSSYDSCRVTCAMGMNSTVKVLDMTGVRLRSKWAKEFRCVLEQNQSLKEVILSKTCLKNKAVVYVAAGLFKNKTLRNLEMDGNLFSGIGVEHLLCPLSRFSALQMQANISLKSVTFGGPRTKIGRVGLSAILHFLSTNETVTRLCIREDQSLKPQDFIKMFNVLKTNVHLLHLSLQGCQGLLGESVAQAIMETLQVNSSIESLNLSQTPLENAGLLDAIYQKLEQSQGHQSQISKDETEFDGLKDMSMSCPKSCRAFFCGQYHSGKTTLCDSISHHFSSSSFPYSEQVKILVKPIEKVTRRSGLQIKSFRENDIKISIWNLASQHELHLYPLQDLMFPGHGSGTNSAAFFFIVSSLFHNRKLKTPEQVEEDIHYWLRFIVSASRRAKQELMLPNVTIVLTHFDKINQQCNNMEHIVSIVQNLRDKFQGFVDFCPTVFTIDARSHSSVSKLTYHLKVTSNAIIQRVPKVYDLANEVIQLLLEWRGRNGNRPVMRWGEFAEICQVKVPFLRVQTRGYGRESVEMRRNALAKCLHDLGEVMYFEELGLLILDFEWFCNEVLGQVVNLNVIERSGFVSRSELEKTLKKNFQSQIPGMSSRVLEYIEACDLISMMLKLELCYLQDPSDRNSLLLMPSMLQEGRGRSQKWDLNEPECVYAGRHFECDKASHVLLTPGFFPKLQVHLYNKVMGGGNQHGARYSLEKYLVVISINGVSIRVELCGQTGHFVDVLACSTKSLTETLRLIQQLIITAIHSCCYSVPLTEHIIRPECVKNLTPPSLRMSQSIQVQRLKKALLSVPAEEIYEYKHTWSEVRESGGTGILLRSGFDFARELVSEDDFREVLSRRYHDLYNLAIELEVPEERPENPSSTAGEIVDPTLGGIAKGVEQVLQRLKIIEQEIKDVKQEIQGLRYYEHRLLLELNRKVEHLVNGTFQVEERKVPNMFYFVQSESYSRRLVMNMVSGMSAMRLHMLCEFRGEMHVVEDQIGCEVMQVDNRAVQLLAPYMKKFMKLVTFALKIGAHLAVGMGEMIPDLSREVERLSDSSVMYAAAAGGVVGAAAALGGRRRRRGDGGRDIEEEQRVAQQWVIDFLRDRRCSSGKDIAEKFGLWRVRYRNDGRIAWICGRHMNTRAQEIVELPF